MDNAVLADNISIKEFLDRRSEKKDFEHIGSLISKVFVSLIEPTLMNYGSVDDFYTKNIVYMFEQTKGLKAITPLQLYVGIGQHVSDLELCQKTAKISQEGREHLTKRMNRLNELKEMIYRHYLG